MHGYDLCKATELNLILHLSITSTSTVLNVMSLYGMYYKKNNNNNNSKVVNTKLLLILNNQYFV